MSIICLLRIGVWAQAQEIVTFDAPGADTTSGDFSGTYPSGVNAWGFVTGYYQGSDTVSHGFIRSLKGDYITFEAPGADTTPGSYNGTNPTAINDLGMIAGYYYDASGFSHGFLRSPEGKVKTFDVPGAAGYGTFPRAMNVQGAVVGTYTDANYSFRAFLRSPEGKFTTWIGADACTGNGSEGCYGSGASNINFFGIIAGGFEDNTGNFVHHNFLRNANGKLKVFDIPGAGNGNSQGSGCPGCNLGLNQFGAVAGIFSDANSVNHGFLRSPDGRITVFDAPGAGTDIYQGTGCYADCPVSINDWGAIAGMYIDSNYVVHGYVRSPKGHFAPFDPPDSIYTWASGINNQGIVVGYFVDSNDVFHGFIRKP